LHQHAPKFSSLTLMSCTNNFGCTWPKLNTNTSYPTNSHSRIQDRQPSLVKAQFFHMTRPSKKLSDKFLGPYEVLAQPGTHSVTLRLPDSLRAIHPVFHVSMLEPTHPDPIPDRVQPPPPAIMVDDEPEFEISEILDSKINN